MSSFGSWVGENVKFNVGNNFMPGAVTLNPSAGNSSNFGATTTRGVNREEWQFSVPAEPSRNDSWRYNNQANGFSRGGPESNRYRSNSESRHQNYPASFHNIQSSSKQVETDPVVLARRQKQVDYGKNTREYINYTRCVPLKDRQPFHPKTPPMYRKYSRRAWDGLIKQWRLNLHSWSEPSDDLDGGIDCGSLNASFSSEATTGSTSTTSSMAQSLSVFQDFEIQNRRMEVIGENSTGWQHGEKQPELHIDANSNVEFDYGKSNGYHMFSPPATRPASSLCFSEYQHFTSGMDFLLESRRQASSQTDLTSEWRQQPQFNGNSGFARDGSGFNRGNQENQVSDGKSAQYQDYVLNDFKSLRF